MRLGTLVRTRLEHMRRFQLGLIDPTRCLYRVCLEPDLDEAERQRTLEEVRARFGEVLAEKNMRNVRFDVEALANIPPDTRTGKFRLIVPATSES